MWLISIWFLWEQKMFSAISSMCWCIVITGFAEETKIILEKSLKCVKTASAQFQKSRYWPSCCPWVKKNHNTSVLKRWEVTEFSFSDRRTPQAESKCLSATTAGSVRTPCWGRSTSWGRNSHTASSATRHFSPVAASCATSSSAAPARWFTNIQLTKSFAFSDK